MRFDSLSGWMPSSTVRLILLAVVVSHLLGNTAMPLTMPAVSGQTAARKAVEGGCCCSATGRACQCGSKCCGSAAAPDDPEQSDTPNPEPGQLVWIKAPLRSPCNGLGAGSILLVPAVLSQSAATVRVFAGENPVGNTEFRQLLGISRKKPTSPPPKI